MKIGYFVFSGTYVNTSGTFEMTSKFWKNMFLQLLSRVFLAFHDCVQLREIFFFNEMNVRNIIFRCFYRMMVHAGFK